MQAHQLTRALSGTGILVVAGLLSTTITQSAPADEEESPDVLELTGIARDFLERTDNSQPDVDPHPDFERRPDNGFGHYCGNIAQTIGMDRKPVYEGGGFRVEEGDQWLDSAGRPICYTLFDPELGDVAGDMGPSDDGAIQDSASFDQWYRDVLGVNQSLPLTITMVRQPDGTYLFDDTLDPTYEELGGFFPMDGKCYGNSPGSPDHNFHFTFELHAKFVHDASANHYFQFIGDDDVWVFIDDKLVIDLGGVHPAVEQSVDLSRLGLEDGTEYRLDFFFAERHRTQSNFRINTSLLLQSVDVPTVSAVFD
jgi:fibro-slime domain-containing protein